MTKINTHVFEQCKVFPPYSVMEIKIDELLMHCLENNVCDNNSISHMFPWRNFQSRSVIENQHMIKGG